VAFRKWEELMKRRTSVFGTSSKIERPRSVVGKMLKNRQSAD